MYHRASGLRYFLGFWNLIGRLVVELETDKTFMSGLTRDRCGLRLEFPNGLST